MLLTLLVSCAIGPGQYDRATLSERGGDAAVFASRCSLCHALPHPARHDMAGWQVLVPLMEMRMSQRGVPPLSDAERVSILSYLGQHAR